jgi:hypothetical protein
MSLTIGGLPSTNRYGWIIIDANSNSITKAISQAFPKGELWGINSQAFSKGSLKTALGVISAEKLYTRTLENYVSVAVSEMKLRPPFIVELGAVGLNGVYLGAPHPELPSGHYYGPIREPSLVHRSELSDIKEGALFNILRAFFNELYDLAECSRPDLLTDEIVRRNGIPPRT